MRIHRHPSVSDLINRQVFKWREDALARGDASELPEEGVKREPFGPYLTLSREFGAGALSVAEELSERLGWTVYDRQIIEEVAKDAKVSKAIAESLDERTRVWIEEYIANLGFMPSLSEGDFSRHLAKVVTTLARHGNAILVGRGCSFILPPESGVRVRLTAPLDWRARVVAAGQHISDAEARARIERVDKERAEYIHHLFGRKIEDMTFYDAVLDVSKLPRPAVVGAIIELLGRKLGVREDVERARSPGGRNQLAHITY